MLVTRHCRTIAAAGALLAAAPATGGFAPEGKRSPEGIPRDTGVAAEFPFGVYDKVELAPASEQWPAYYERVTSLLKENNVNTLIVQPYKDVKHTLYVMDRAQASGLRVVMSVGNPLNPAWDYIGPRYPFYRAYKHPSVIAYKYGDEPDDANDVQILSNAYAAVRLHTRLPIVTAMAGEAMDFTPTQVASVAWLTLRTELRFARHYPVRREYDLDDWYKDKMRLPFPEWARQMEECCDSPWWLILQTFGKGLEKNQQAYWRLPTAAELNAMAHIGLAYGARGIMGYALQDHSGQFLGLVDEQRAPRRARDGSVPLVAYRQLGSLVQAHADFLLRHRRGAFAVHGDNEKILTVPRVDPKTGIEYIYLVNKDAVQTQHSTLRVQGARSARGAVDVFMSEGERHSFPAEANGTFSCTIAAGEAQLWQLLP